MSKTNETAHCYENEAESLGLLSGGQSLHGTAVSSGMAESTEDIEKKLESKNNFALGWMGPVLPFLKESQTGHRKCWAYLIQIIN